MTVGGARNAAVAYGSAPSARAGDPDRQRRLVAVLERLERWGSARDWIGTDPYDGVNATRLVGPLPRTHLGRRLLTQVVKRSPVDLRPLLGVRPERNSATMAYVASAYALDDSLGADANPSKLRRAIGLLETMRLPGYQEPCWGYHFPLQTRMSRGNRDEPNTIATVYAGMALLDAHERTREPRLLDLARETGAFFLRHVTQTVTPGGAYFGYWVGDTTPVHNANLHACAFLARLSAHGNGDRFAAAARRGVAYALAHQKDDGSWDYGELPSLRWVDNFHTGFVLDALEVCDRAGIDPRIGEALRRGLKYYRDELFLGDGTPKYFNQSVYPIDAQCVAQGIQTFAIASERDRNYLADAWRVLDFGVAKMMRRDGAFAFQRRRLWRDPAAHMRGANASMLLGLTHLLAASRRSDAGDQSAPLSA